MHIFQKKAFLFSILQLTKLNKDNKDTVAITYIHIHTYADNKIMALNLRVLFLALIMFSQVYLTTCYSNDKY